MPIPSTSKFGKLLLVGLGSDGAQVLSLIAQNLKRNFLGNSSWKENYPMVAVGVKEIEPFPGELDPSINCIELEPNLSWFQGLDRQNIPLYLDWWDEAGRPTAGRGLARLAFFNQFKDESPNSLLNQVLIEGPRLMEIQDYYIITSLSDIVGSAIMWDVIHLLERSKAEQTIRSSSVLWLAIKGQSNTIESAPYAWRELTRLGNGGNVNVLRNRFDQIFNKGYLKNGLDRIVVVNDSPDDLRQIQDATDSSKLLAEIISLTLTPSFSQAFISDWVPANGKRQELALPISTFSNVTFFIPTDLIKEICILRMARSLLWGGLSKGIPGIFDNVMLDLDGSRFSPKAFLSRIMQDLYMSPNRTKTGEINRLFEYKRRILETVDEILNGNSAERDSQRKALAGKLSLAIKFLDSLQNIIGESKSTPYAEMGQINRDLLVVLRKWGQDVLEKKNNGAKPETIQLQVIIDTQLRNKRIQLTETMQADDRHLVLVHPGTDESQWEDAVYQEWQEYLISLEKPGLFDPISNFLAELKWNCTIEDDSFAIRLSIGKNEKGKGILFEPSSLITIVDRLKGLLLVKTGKELLSEGLAKRLDELFRPSKVYEAIQKSGNRWMEAGILNAVHIIGADSNGVALLAKRLKSIGQNPETHDNIVGDPNQISIISIRDRVDQSTLFTIPVRTPQRSKFVYSAEMAFSELEQKVLLGKAADSSKLSEQFTYFLSDPALAGVFGNGLLLGFITYRDNEFKYTEFDSNRRFLFGAGVSQGLFFRDHPILAAMEDFVIELPGKVDDSHHPLHPESRRETIMFEEKILKSKGNGTKNEIEERYEKIVVYIHKFDTHQSIVNTFQLWLSIIKNKILDD